VIKEKMKVKIFVIDVGSGEAYITNKKGEIFLLKPPYEKLIAKTEKDTEESLKWCPGFYECDEIMNDTLEAVSFLKEEQKLAYERTEKAMEEISGPLPTENETKKWLVKLGFKNPKIHKIERHRVRFSDRFEIVISTSGDAIYIAGRNLTEETIMKIAEIINKQ
jgi:predicted ribosome quality control (RQC) complex YloA/Tae2 family protein